MDPAVVARLPLELCVRRFSTWAPIGTTCSTLDDLLRDQVTAARFLIRQIVHDVQHDFFDDRAQAARPGVFLHRPTRNGPQRLVGEVELAVLHAEQALILPHQSVLRFGQHADHAVFIQRRQGTRDRQPANQFGNQPVLQNVVTGDLRQQFGQAAIRGLLASALLTKPDAPLAQSFADDVVDTRQTCRRR